MKGELARWWHPHGDGAVCRLCPHACALGAKQPEGFCGVRWWDGHELRTRNWGGAAALHLDPVEKKPLYHFLPGSRAYSLGMYGCNLSCQFCQNWGLSMARGPVPGEWVELTPASIVESALGLGARSVAFTYNEPLLGAEFWLEVASLCHERGLYALAVSNGFAAPEAAKDFYGAMDGANIDLKSFCGSFYRQICSGSLASVLHTLRLVRELGSCHLEITNLLVPGKNDDAEEIVEMCRWIRSELGPEVPLHFSAWHPDYQAASWPEVPYRTDVREARRLALSEGLCHVYTGNISDSEGACTYCPGCGEMLIRREGFAVKENTLREGACPACGRRLNGQWQ